MEIVGLNAGDRGDQVFLRRVANGTGIVVNGGSGSDVFHVASDEGLDWSLGGLVTINGQGGLNQLTIDDRSDAGDDAYLLNAIGASVLFTKNSATGGVLYSSMQDVSVYGNEFDNDFRINASGPLSIHGEGGGDQFVLGSGDLFNHLTSNIRIDGGVGEDTVTVDDRTATIEGGYLFAANMASDGTEEGRFEKFTVFGGFPFPIVYRSGELTTQALEELRLQGSPQADEFEVAATPTRQNLILEGNAGRDDFRISASGLRSNVQVVGGDPVASVIEGDALFVTGTDADIGSYLPGANTNDGRVTANGHNIDFSGLEPVYAQGFGTFSFVTPRSHDVIDVREYTPRQFPTPPSWTEISGTSGLLNTGFEVLRVRDIGTLAVVLYAFDLVPEAPSNAFNPNDSLTIHPDALGGNRVDLLRIFAGIGSDVVSDHTLNGNPATTALEVIGSVGVRHEIHGGAHCVVLGQSDGGISTARSYNASGDLIHNVRDVNISQVILVDPQRQVEFESRNVQLQLLEGATGPTPYLGRANPMRILGRSGEGRFIARLGGDSTIEIIATLFPRFELQGQPDLAARTTIVNGLRGPQVTDSVYVTGFDGHDTLVVRTPGVPGTNSLFEVDLRDRGETQINVCEIPDLRCHLVRHSISASRGSSPATGRRSSSKVVDREPIPYEWRGHSLSRRVSLRWSKS